jgi:hypothetical protein|tara:strand:- start:7177 stop:7527 length:351 start_codon:yes stop_codon:yes gene_type:complete
MSTHTEPETPKLEETFLEKDPENDSEYIESEISSEDIEDKSSLFDNEGVDLDDIGSINISDDEDDYEEPFIDMGGLLTSVLTTEEGETVCSALINISRQLEMQNKIMIKMLAQLQK